MLKGDNDLKPCTGGDNGTFYIYIHVHVSAGSATIRIVGNMMIITAMITEEQQ